MPITIATGVVTETPMPDRDQFVHTGVARKDGFAICGGVDKSKQISFDPSAQATNTTCTIASQASSSGTFNLPNTAGGFLAQDGNGGQLNYQAPTNGASIAMAAADRTLVMEPAGTIAGATVTLPVLPPDGTIVSLSSTQIITTLTLNAGSGDTIVNAITTLIANAFAAYVYRLSSKKWYRIG